MQSFTKKRKFSTQHSSNPTKIQYRVRVKNLIADRNIDNAFGRENGRFGRAADDGETAFTHGTSGLNLRPLYDTEKAEVMVATIDTTSDNCRSMSSFSQANPTAIRFLFRIRKFELRFAFVGCGRGRFR